MAKIDEGSELRKFLSKKSKIAVFDGYLDYQDSVWEEHDLIPVCNTIEQAELASKNNIKFMLHIDTGMNRLGVSSKEAENLMKDKGKLNSNNLILIINIKMPPIYPRSKPKPEDLPKFLSVEISFSREL